MIEVLRKLLELAESGKLEIENVSLNDSGHVIDINHAVSGFDGDITIEVKAEADVIMLGHMLKEAIDKEK